MPDGKDTTGWGWSSTGGWSYEGAPQAGGPTTQQGTKYDPGTDPVLDAFRAGYNLPAPGQGGATTLAAPPGQFDLTPFRSDTNPQWQQDFAKWLGGGKTREESWADFTRSLSEAMPWEKKGVPPVPQTFEEWLKVPPLWQQMWGKTPQQGVATQGTPRGFDTGLEYGTWPESWAWSPELAAWSTQEQQRLADVARIKELSARKPLSPEVKTAAEEWTKPNESRAIIEEPVDANGYPAIQTAEQETAFYEKYAYNKAYYDQSGNLLTDNEVTQLAGTNPNTLVTRVYDIGGGKNQYITDTALSFEEEGGVTAGWLGQMAQSKEAAAKVEAYQKDLQTKKDEILKDVNAGNYQEKRAELYNLYGTGYQAELTQPSAGGTWEQAARLGMAGTPDWYDVGAEIMEALSPKDREAVQAQATEEQDTDEWNARMRQEWQYYIRQTGSTMSFEDYKAGEWRKEKAFDTGSLQESIASYGISVLDNYPYISPISPSQLRKIPVDVLEQMSSYLQSKGINWNDFVSIGSSWYGGQAGAGGRWAIPAQWG